MKKDKKIVLISKEELSKHAKLNNLNDFCGYFTADSKKLYEKENNCKVKVI